MLQPPEQQLVKDVEELLRTVDSNEKGKGGLRGRAAGHSLQFYNPLVGPTEIDVTAKEYQIEPHFDPLNDILTASAGTSLDTLRDFLRSYDAKLRGTPESARISLGGAIVVGAHNGSSLFPSIADDVVELWLVDGQGRVRIIGDPRLVVNVGLLGIVFRVRIRTVPARNMRWERTLFDGMDAMMKETGGPNAHTHSLVFGPYSGKVLRVQVEETDEPKKKGIARYLWEGYTALVSTRPVSAVIQVVASAVPSVGLLVSEMFLYEPNAVRDRFDYFDVAPYSKVYTMEYGLPIEQLVPVYERIMAVIALYRKHYSTYISYRFWCRFIDASPWPLRLNSKRRTVIMELTFAKDQPSAERMACVFDDIFLSAGGRPHMGKSLVTVHATSQYAPELRALLSLARTDYDPNGVFVPAFIHEAKRENLQHSRS